jgi:PcfJ-like protein
MEWLMADQENRASFGVFPQLKLYRTNQDPEASKDMPLQALRGRVAGTLGLPSDLVNLPLSVVNALADTDYQVPYGTEHFQKTLPLKPTSPAGDASSEVGSFFPSSVVLKAELQGLKHLGKMAGSELGRRAVMGESFTPFVNIAMPMTHVIKPKGGNWQSIGIDLGLSGLKTNKTAAKQLEEMRKVYPPEEMIRMSPETRQVVEQAFPHLEKQVALNNWIDKNLTNYIKKEMGTPEDPVRKLAEQGITHLPPNTLINYSEDVDPLTKSYRKMAGYPEEGMGQSSLAKGWENLVDSNTNVSTAKELTDPKELSKKIGLSLNNAKVATKLNLSNDPYLSKIDSNTPIYSNKMLDRFGFDHILDVLKEDVASGRLRPESLKNVSMEQAVRRTHEYDQEMAKKMAEAQIKATEGMPVHKEYPTGHKWIELKIPDYNALPLEERKQMIAKLTEEAKQKGLNPLDYISNYPQNQLSEALKYEGETMGHCVGGYCPDVVAGRSRIFSLRDAKGEPHVTIEVMPNTKHPIGYNTKGKQTFPNDFEYNYKKLPQEQHQAIHNRAKEIFDSLEYESPSSVMDAYQQAANEIIGNPPQNIVQIKGKQNLAPKEQYLPFVQDFVKSGNWGDVGDLHNTGLTKKTDIYDWDLLTPEQQNLMHEIEPSEYITPEAYKIFEERKASLNPQPPVEGMKKGGAVTISDNPDTMFMELMDRHFAGGGAITKLARAIAKKPEEIRAIAERIAPQVTGEVSGVIGKSNKQFQHEKSLPIDIRVDKSLPDPNIVDLAKHKGKVMIGIKGDPTVTNQTLHKVGDIELESPSPQHGGPMYGHGKDVFWASGLSQARGVQNLAKEAMQAYDAPVLGNYFMMGPDSYYYAQHLADANLNAIAKSGMTEEQIEKLNELIRKGGPLSKGPKPNFETVSDVGNAYMQMQMDPKLRKHFNQLMMKPTLSEEIGIPSGQDIAYAITEPKLRNLERGVSGQSFGEMRPDQPLRYSSHPTYSHDIPGAFLGTSEFPIPYELSFPDTVQSVRLIPHQAVQEFGSFGMVGPRQIIDQQLIDEIGEYQRRMKTLTGKKKGGIVKKAKGGEISEDDIQMEVRPL